MLVKTEGSRSVISISEVSVPHLWPSPHLFILHTLSHQGQASVLPGSPYLGCCLAQRRCWVCDFGEST